MKISNLSNSSTFALLRSFFLKVDIKNSNVQFRKFYFSKSDIANHLETIGVKFLYGYHSALKISELTALCFKLKEENNLYQGFCFEGAAMAITILDGISLFKINRTSNFLISKDGQKHNYMIYVGAGWAYARLPVKVEKRIEKYDPVLRWLIIDGYGFHQAYFKTKKYVYNKTDPKELKSDFSKHVFYQGLGRCLWFVEGTSASRIFERIKSFPVKYHPDLWSGVGLACTYAGGVEEVDIKQLKALCGDFLPCLMQGSAFAAKSRHQAEIIVPHVEMASNIICNMSVQEVSAICDYCLTLVPNNISSEEKYEMWRTLISSSLYKTIENERICTEVLN